VEGIDVEMIVGVKLANAEGRAVEQTVGPDVVSALGNGDGFPVGFCVGLELDDIVGSTDDKIVGEVVGLLVGINDGIEIG